MVDHFTTENHHLPGIIRDILPAFSIENSKKQLAFILYRRLPEPVFRQKPLKVRSVEAVAAGDDPSRAFAYLHICQVEGCFHT